MRRNSPLTGRPWISSIIFFERSPSATAVITRPTSVVGWARLSISVLIESTAMVHMPEEPESAVRSVSLPSSLMILLTRTISLAMPSLRQQTSLNTWAISPRMPFWLLGNRMEKSPRRTARKASSNSTSRSSMSPAALGLPACADLPSPPCESAPLGPSKKTERPGLRVVKKFAMEAFS